jgi:hypothetical protein
MKIRLLSAVLLAGLIACGGDSPTEPTQASLAGTWSLTTINGSPLPYTIALVGTDKVEVVSDVLNVSSNGTFTQLTSVRTTSNGQATTDNESDSGTYTISGTAVTFHFQSDGSTGTATWSGNTMTVAESGLSGVYKKQ